MSVRPLLAAVALLHLPLFPASISSSIGLAVPATLVSMCVLSAMSPAIGIAALAALVPVIGALGALMGTSPLGPALLAGVVSGAALHRLAHLRTVSISPWVTGSTTVFVLVALASGAVQLWVMTLQVPGWPDVVRILWKTFPRDYLLGRSEFRHLAATLLLVQGSVLVPLVASLCADSRARPWLHRGLVTGAVLLAAHMIARVLEIALRGDDFGEALIHIFQRVRVSPSIPDQNATGSLLALGGLLSLGLPAMFRARGAWVIPLLLFLGVWQSGSRTALAAIVVALALAWMVRGHWWRGIVAVIAACLVIISIHHVRPRGSPATALLIRVELAKTALRITETAPLFGVGVGEFYRLSEQYASPALRRYYVRENAHNNFLQLLAEIGLVGLGAFVGLLAAVTIPAIKMWWGTRQQSTPWVLVSLTAYLLTCLGGHPLLLPQGAIPFWLTLGLLAAVVESARPLPVPPARARHWAVVAAAVVVMASIPVRARAAVDAANLEHRGISVSRWRRDDRGTRFRTFAGEAAVFAPVSLRGVALGMRLGRAKATPGASAEVRLSLDGQMFARVQVTTREWHHLEFVVPPHEKARFRRIDLESRWVPERPGAPPPVIQLTKVDER